MNWIELINFNFNALRGELADLWRNNRDEVWGFLANRWNAFRFFLFWFVAAHLVSMWAARPGVDAVATLVSELSLLGALIQAVIIYMGGSALLDGSEGFFNIFSGVSRRVAQLWHGQVMPIEGDEDLGIDKMINAARHSRLVVFGLLAANTLWWIVIWGAYLQGAPIGAEYRLMLGLTFVLALCTLGYASAQAESLTSETDEVVAERLRGSIRLNRIACSVTSVLFAALAINALGLFSQFSGHLPTMPKVDLNWSNWEWMVAGGLTLLILGAMLKGRRDAEGTATYEDAGRWTQRIALVLLLIAFGPMMAGWWSDNKDTIQRDILPTRSAEAVEKLSDRALSALEGTAQAASVSNPAVPPAKPTVDFNFEFCNCLDQAGKLDLQWKDLRSGDKFPLDREKLDIPARGEQGFKRRFSNLAAPPGQVLWLDFVERKRHTLEVNGSTDPAHVRRDPDFSNLADPLRKWGNLEFVDGFWRLSLGCKSGEEP